MKPSSPSPPGLCFQRARPRLLLRFPMHLQQQNVVHAAREGVKIRRGPGKGRRLLILRRFFFEAVWGCVFCLLFFFLFFLFCFRCFLFFLFCFSCYRLFFFSFCVVFVSCFFSAFLSAPEISQQFWDLAFCCFGGVASLLVGPPPPPKKKKGNPRLFYVEFTNQPVFFALKSLFARQKPTRKQLEPCLFLVPQEKSRQGNRKTQESCLFFGGGGSVLHCVWSCFSSAVSVQRAVLKGDSGRPPKGGFKTYRNLQHAHALRMSLILKKASTLLYLESLKPGTHSLPGIVQLTNAQNHHPNTYTKPKSIPLHFPSLGFAYRKPGKK